MAEQLTIDREPASPPPPPPGRSFLEAAALERVDPGRFRAVIPDSWNVCPYPQGGLVTSLVLRAMQDELAMDALTPRSLHTTFVAPVASGPVELEVEVVRRGRSMSHVRAEVRNPGKGSGHLVTCVFGASRDGFEVSGLCPPPDRRPPTESRAFRDPLAFDLPADFEIWPFWAHEVEGCLMRGRAGFEDVVPAGDEQVRWYRLDNPPTRPDGTLDPVGLVVLADLAAAVVDEHVGRQDRRWFSPSVDLRVHLIDEWRSPWVLAQNRLHHAGDGYGSAELVLWDCGPAGDGDPRLVAHASQVFLFSFGD